MQPSLHRVLLSNNSRWYVTLFSFVDFIDSCSISLILVFLTSDVFHNHSGFEDREASVVHVYCFFITQSALLAHVVTYPVCFTAKVLRCQIASVFSGGDGEDVA